MLSMVAESLACTASESSGIAPAESGQRRTRRDKWIGLDGECGSDQRRACAADRRHQTHQRIAVGNNDVARAVRYPVNAAGDCHDRRMGLGEARRRVARGVVAGQRGELHCVEAHDCGPLREDVARKLRARRRPLDEHRIEHPGLAPCLCCADRRIDRRAPFGVERAEINEQRIRAGDEGADLFRRNRHRWHRAGRQQHICGELLRNAVGDAMHARRPRPQTRQDIGGDIGKLDRGMHFS